MAIYKQGCTDKTVVQKIQKVVGVTADGIWGAKTTDAVKNWQRKNGLTADGIVGPQTLTKMGITAFTSQTSKTIAPGVDITLCAINTHITPCANRQPKYIVIHYTAGGSSKSGTAMATRNVFLQRAASADFVVDDATIVQINPDPRNYYCWAVGDKKNPYTGGGRLNGIASNRNVISIEICSTLAKGTSPMAANHDGWTFTKQAVDNALHLTRYLMKQYGIPRDNVIRHYDVTGKLCPGIPGWNDGPLFSTDGKQLREHSNSQEWQEFLRNL